MNHLETLLFEYFDWQDYLVKANIAQRVGRLNHGGYNPAPPVRAGEANST